MEKLTVIYNGSCPICSREIDTYRRKTKAAEAPVDYVDLSTEDVSRFGIDPDDAARRLYVFRNGKLIGGIDAFIALWKSVPGFRWLARLVDVPGLRQVASLLYESVAAPALYRMHRRREARS